MQRVGERFLFSPSDLNHFLECEHLIQLDRRRDAHTLAGRRDPHAELLAAKGAAHEQAWLERFRSERRDIAVIESGDRDWDRAARDTVAAMHRGAAVVYQGVFVDGDWRGISDFLVRVDRPSRLGNWSYEAWDAKLARQTKPYFVLQLCFYTEQLARIQGVEPEAMCVVLGTSTCDRLRYHDFHAYYRAVRRQFVDAAASDHETHPYPVPHCSLCHYAGRCEGAWHAEDHLSLVAGIRREQVERLHEAGIRTVEQLSAMTSAARIGIGAVALDRLRHQARLQSGFRRSGVHRYELLAADERSGFRLLPPPSPGDLFFDIEGDPYFEPEAGLEYLFGVMTVDDGAPRFHPFLALERAHEKAAFEQLVDFIRERRERWPDLHVYHYAAYETTTLKRLMSAYATREDEMDDLLRGEVFVDLYQVVRQAIRISHSSYSIKKVRTFFMTGAGEGRVTGGGDSILEFERWRIAHDPAILQGIVDYNEEDCLSTLQLRDWLLDRKRELERASGVAIEWPAADAPVENTKRLEEDAATARRREQLRATDGEEAAALADLLDYHRREDKPAWWSYYDRHKKSLDDLLDDAEAIAYLAPVTGREPEKVDRSLVHALRFPEQEFKLSADARAAVEDPFRKRTAGLIWWIDARDGTLGLKRGSKRASEPLPAALVPGKPIGTSAQRQALARVADAVIAGTTGYAAVRALLARELPRVRGRRTGAPLQTSDLDGQKALVASLDSSYLVVQGPPGTGKTWTGARLIVSLIAAGKRVGVAATSHKAINNMLSAIEAAAIAEHVTFTGVKKGSDDDKFGGRFVRDTPDNEECETADCDLIAGTAWLFARERMDQRVDYLFVDEAGQVALADAIAMGTAARNLVLIGDPQQLPHVRQGVHPGGSGCSVLEHALQGAATVDASRGLFLERTWRMHPDVCGFVSALSYDDRLVSASGCARQRIDSAGLSGTGLRYLPVHHSGNAQRSSEEADVVAAQVRALLSGGTFTDADGMTRALTPADILVVAPYNMHVRCIQERVPPGVEVGTVDKFQGREAAVVFFSMASSTGDDVPRGVEFLFSRNRLNVAVSRARALAILVCSPRLLETRCRNVEQMRLVNGLCAFAERAQPG
jgi:predicted RecB family nuclease